MPHPEASQRWGAAWTADHNLNDTQPGVGLMNDPTWTQGRQTGDFVRLVTLPVVPRLRSNGQVGSNRK
jgi:hypothetical protein